MGLLGLFCGILFTTESVIAFQIGASPFGRDKRTFNHPAYTMLSMYPGLRMGMGSSYGSQDCIREEIVCPDYCLMEDEWGCKFCPCGPANGMSPAVLETYKTTERPNEEHECLGTILCMLTCKDGYRLGPRTNNGCQSCECTKKNNTDPDQHTNQLSSKNDTSKNQTDENSECVWPMCMNGQSPNTGPGAGSGLSALPKGGSNSGQGGSIPGIDCIGPACSAKNGGMRPMTVDSQGGRKPTTSARPHTPHSTCPSQESCSRQCNGVAQLGPLGNDGCPVCDCIIIKVPTTPSSRLFTSPPKPAEKLCPDVDRCVRTCTYGYTIDQPTDSGHCPSCECVLPLTPYPSTTRKPSIAGLLHVCQAALRCMNTCTSGYTMTSYPHEECPVCTCNKEAGAILTCESPLSCPNGCTVGYRCDQSGCPTCNCVKPTEALLTIEVHTTTLESALNCGPKFYCVERCYFGYTTGDGGCPTCTCLQPVTGNNIDTSECHHDSCCHCLVVIKTDSLQLIPTPAPVHNNGIVLSTNPGSHQSMGRPVVPSCTGPACSAIQTIGGIHTIGLSNNLPFTLPQSVNTQNSGLVNLSIKLPMASPDANNNLQTAPVDVHYRPTVGTDNSYTQLHVPVNVHGHIPTGTIENIDAHATFPGKVHNSVPLVHPISTNDNSVLPAAQLTNNGHFTDNDGHGTTSRPMTAMEACPETVKCISKCNGHFELIPVKESSCPTCSCQDIETSCESCTPGKEEVPSTPSPGQCVAILHCVMTCTEGYDIGSYGPDGCPTCTCLEL